MMRVGIAADDGGFALKQEVAESLRGSGYDMVDFGAHQLDSSDDYPDFTTSSPGPSHQERSELLPNW
jgi:ribose 5-phosphate isomerase RpiB